MNKKIAITTGDLKGIGEELVYKALLELSMPKEDILIVGKNIGLGYETIEIKDKNNGDFCFNSLVTACELVKYSEIKGIVTAPVSKKVLNDAGHKFSGQTEILEKFLGTKTEKAEMLFIAKDLRVMLLTRHLPFKNVKIKKKDITEKISRLNNFLIEKCKVENPKIAMCALNPHAGEEGILGYEEIKIITPAILELQRNGINISGPYPADALFASVGNKYLMHEKQPYDAVVSCYHDQGLCAVKAIAFDEVVNTTIGLKVIRTSPSGGTAYDIAGKNIANPKSMIEAVKLAHRLS